jgi:hypothetical protein
MELETSPKENKPLYSQRAIGIATFFGGPLAAGILVQRNYINLGNEWHGKHALSIGILSTLAMFIGIFSLPEDILDKIPNSVFPAIYTLIIYLVVEKLQGNVLKTHKANNGPFYSAWKATGIGFVCMLVIIAGVFGYTYFSTEFDSEKYDKGLASVQRLEDEALELYSMSYASPEKIIEFIDKKGLPNWKNCIHTLNEMDAISGLPKGFKQQNQILREYYQLRLESYQLIKKANLEITDKYDGEIESINTKMETLLSDLKSINF